MSLLFLFFLSIFLLIVAPIEIYKTIDARSWKSVEVKVISNEIAKDDDFYLNTVILDMSNQKASSNVSIRYGEPSFTIVFFGKLIGSTYDKDKDRYRAGAVIKAYRSPDKKTYVLEQNTITEMLILFMLGLIYPGITIALAIKNRLQKT